MRLIDAESPQNGIYVSDLVIEEMKKIPTVDIDRPTRSQFKRMAVQLGYEPVVRCEDCKHHEDEEPGMVWCPYFIGSWVENKFFCAYGERKNNGNEDRA